MNIAICDDNVYMGTKIESIVSACFPGGLNAVTCDVYLSGEELLHVLRAEPLKYQIYLLDVEMKEIDGLKTAASIREQDKDAVIIFITSHDELMPEAFDVNAFHYLIKPIDEEKVKQVVLRAVQAFEAKRTLFQFVVRKKIRTLYLCQIEFFESYGRKMIVHTTDGHEYEYYGTLKDVLNKIPDRLFAQVHNSYVINMEHIRTSGGEEIMMDSGRELTITKKFNKTFQKAYHQYALMQAGN